MLPNGIKGFRYPAGMAAGRSLAASLAVLAGVLSGCRGDRSNDNPRSFFPDMDDQPKLKAQSKSEFFKEFSIDDGHGGHTEHFGRGMRLPVAGTVAFGRSGRAGTDGTDVWQGKDFGQRAQMLQADDMYYHGYVPVLDAAGKQVMNADETPKRTYAEYIPIPVTRELIAEGQQQYSIYCLPCHGGVGDGQGLVGQRWSAPLPTYHDPKYFHGGDKGSDGYLYSVIREGVKNIPGAAYPYKMRPYARKMTEHESWAIIAYLRTLQETRKGSMGDVPASEREKLMTPNTNPAPGSSPAATTGGAS